jgi:hypothetical protein
LNIPGKEEKMVWTRKRGMMVVRKQRVGVSGRVGVEEIRERVL